MKTILDNYLIGNETVYGLKLKESNPVNEKTASQVLLPTNSRHTRYYFAKLKQQEIIIELAKRISNGWSSRGTFGLKAIEKINQCSRICEHYTNS